MVDRRPACLRPRGVQWKVDLLVLDKFLFLVTENICCWRTLDWMFIFKPAGSGLARSGSFTMSSYTI